MLINKGVSAGEVITLKLTSGEELIGKLVEETDTHYKLAKTQVIAMGPKGPGLMPYLYTVHPDKDIPLKKDTVTVCVPTDADFAKQYLEATSGIQIV